MTIEDVEHLDSQPTDGCLAMTLATLAVCVVAVVVFAIYVLWGGRL